MMSKQSQSKDYKDKRLYDEFLLNLWINKSENHRKLIEQVFNRSRHFIFKEVKTINSFNSVIFDPDDLENSHTKRFRKYLEDHPEDKTQKIVKELFYERYVRDYVIEARIVDCFGLKLNVTLLAEVRARFAQSSFLNHRLSDLQILHNEGLHDPKLQQLKRDDNEFLLINDKNFATVLITKYDSRGHPLPAGDYPLFVKSGGVIIHRVPKEELHALERENW